MLVDTPGECSLLVSDTRGVYDILGPSTEQFCSRPGICTHDISAVAPAVGRTPWEKVSRGSQAQEWMFSGSKCEAGRARLVPQRTWM